MNKKRICVAIVCQVLTGVLAFGVASAQNGLDQALGNYEVYLGVTPARIIAKYYPTGSAERTMDGGVPTNPNDDHVMIALFNKVTGKRVTNATVSAKVWTQNLQYVPVQRKALQPMAIAGDVTYGNYFYMPGKANYDIKVYIRRPGSSALITTLKYER